MAKPVRPGMATGWPCMTSCRAGPVDRRFDARKCSAAVRFVGSGEREGSAFVRAMRPQGVALPILNCAVWLERDGGNLKDVHIAVGPGGGTPFRAIQAEDLLRGELLNETIFECALEALLAQAQFRSSARRASVDYRRHIISEPV